MAAYKEILHYQMDNYYFNSAIIIFELMKFTPLILFLIPICLFQKKVEAQKYLPNFSVVEITKGNNKVSWNNPFKTCTQLAVQRSTDSVNNFRTILSAHSPELTENGFIDKKAPVNSKVYYRIFYTLKGGDYYFSKVVSASIVNEQTKLPSKKKKKSRLKKYSKEKKSSNYLSIGTNGNIYINLPKAKQLKYKLVIFDTDNSTLFTIEKITEVELILEKNNFLHTGWFKYELYEEGRLLQKNRFQIEKIN